MSQFKIGLLVNPIAGMGGAVGLKGTDGPEILERAIEKGAQQKAKRRMSECLAQVDEKTLEKISFLTCSGKMGADVLEKNSIEHKVVYEPKKDTTPEDTKKACGKFLQEKANLVFFCGGDGTARDIHSVVKRKTPMMGVPAGVKMYSSVFAVNPVAAARLLKAFVDDPSRLMDSEILDIDEEKYRQDELSIRVFGYGLTPREQDLMQGSKTVSFGSEEEYKRGIGVFAKQFMRDSSLYLVSAGTTTRAIFKEFGLQEEKTLLGVDAIKDGKILGKDLSEKEILDLVDEHNSARIIVSPIGAQGFVLGRGNQQLSPRVLRKVGVERDNNRLIIVSTPGKLQSTPSLMIDTGDRELDKKLSGYWTVLCGFHLGARRKIKAI